MALDIRIQQATQSYRETLAGLDEEDVRALAEELGIDGSETTPLVTLREEIAQSWRGDARAEAYQEPQVSTGPGTLADDEESQFGNSGNDGASLIDFYDTP